MLFYRNRNTRNSSGKITTPPIPNSPTLPSFYLRHSSFSKPSVASPTSQFILQPFFRFSYVTSRAHSPTFPSLHLSQLILQHLRRFTYVTAHSPTLLSLHLRHSLLSNHSFASPTSQAELIHQPFRHFTYVTTHSPTLLSLYLRHSSFSNPSVALPTSQLILQPFRCFTYVTGHSPTLLSLLLCHRIFTCVTWRAAHAALRYCCWVLRHFLTSYVGHQRRFRHRA